MKGTRLSGGYKGGKDVERRVLEKRKYLESLGQSENKIRH